MASDGPIACPDDWPTPRLGDICLKIGSGATPKGGDATYQRVRSRHALIRSQNVFDRRFASTGLAYISDAQADELRGAEVRSGDLLLNITGDGVTFSRCCIVPDEILPACVNQHVSIVRVDPTAADPGFVLAYLTHPAVKSYIESFNAGGSRRAITKGHIQSLSLALPPLGEQHRIGEILGALDDRIELNRRMGQTLEATARAVFKSWFVDFDPVSAKAQGRDPGLAAGRAELFPNSFEDSELGNIPAGWNVTTLDDIAVSRRRLADPRQIDPRTPYIGLEHMPRRSITLADWETAGPLESGKAAFRRGEILFGKLRPYFHKVGVAPIDGVCSTDIVVLTSKSDAWYGFVMGHVSSDAFVAYTNAGSTGTKMPRTSWTEMARYPVALPPAAVGAAFTDLVGPMIERILASAHENWTLTAVRDALLPRLVSGELSVTKAERVMEAVL